MLHHLSISVSDIARSARFYDAVLGALGYERVWTEATAVGYGLPAGVENFAIRQEPEVRITPGPHFHLAFRAPTREALVQFRVAALAHGGRENYRPVRHHDHDEHFYPVHMIDPDGYCIEAVFNDPS